MALRLLIALILTICAGAATAAPIDRLALADLGTATMASIGDDGTLLLSDGRSLRLAGIDLPRGPLGRDARQAVTDLAGQGPLALKADGPATDRYGRVVAEVFAADGTWIEGELLRRGLARVATTPDHRLAASALYSAERGACARRLGVWHDPDYALRRPEQAAHMIDSWQVIDGTVVAAEARHGGVELRFGDDRARGLAVRIPAAILRDMDADPTEWAGRHVRVRGWIGKGIGPLIVLSHAEQIEFVGRQRQRVAEER